MRATMKWLPVLLCLVQTCSLVGSAGGEGAPSPQIAFRIAHEKGARSPVFSADGKLVATGGFQGEILLWDARSGELLHTMNTGQKYVNSLAFSPDSATLASMSDPDNMQLHARGKVILWDTATGKLRRQFGEQGPHLYHGGSMRVSYTPDGREVIVVCTSYQSNWPGVVDLWDAQTGAFLRGISGVVSPAISPDGHSLAAGYIDSDTLPLIDGLSANTRSVSPVTAVCHPSGGLEESPHIIKLWNLETGVVLRTLAPADLPIESLVFSPAGRTLAGYCGATSGVGTTGRTEQMILWDIRTGTQRQIPGQKNRAFSSFAFSPDSKTLARAQLETHLPSPKAADPIRRQYSWISGEIVLWDVATGTPRRILPQSGEVHALAYSPDGSRLTAAHEEEAPRIGVVPRAMVSLWNPTTGARLYTRSVAESAGYSWVAYSPDGRTLLVCSGMGWVRWLKADTLKLRAFAPETQHQNVPLSFSPDGRLLASGATNRETALLWDLRTGRLARRLPAANSLRLTTAVAFTANSQTLAILRSNWDSKGIPEDLSLWDVRTGERQAHLKQKAPPEFMDFPDFNTGATDKITVSALWNAIAFSPDGMTLLSGGRKPGVAEFGSVHPGRARLGWWNVPSGTLRFTSQPDTEEVFAIAVTAEGHIAATSGAHETILWDAATGTQIRKMPLLKRTSTDSQMFVRGPTRALAFSSDSRMLACANTDVVQLWNTDTGSEIGLLEGHTESIYAVAFSPDGTLLASASYDGTVRLWDLSTHQTRTVLSHAHPVTSVAFSPNGRLLVSGSTDGALHFWNPRTGALLLTTRVFPARDKHSPSAWIAYTPEGYYEGSNNVSDYLRWQVGDRLLPAATFERRYHRPDRVEAALKTLGPESSDLVPKGNLGPTP